MAKCLRSYVYSHCTREGTISMKICGRAGATGTAQVGVRQGCPLSPTLFGLFFEREKLHYVHSASLAYEAGALGDERHMLLECPALADLRDEYSPLVAECSGVMARLVWARNQPMVSRYIIACLDRMSC